MHKPDEHRDPFEPGEFLAELTPTELAGLRSSGRRVDWLAGETLFTEGERSTSVVLILAGRVKIFSLTAAGTGVVLAVRGPGALLGEIGAIDGGPRGASVAAIEAVRALTVPVTAFVRFLEANPRLPLLLMRTLTNRLRDADRKRVEFGGYDTLTRVSRRLVELALRYGEPTPQGIRIAMPFTQEELAGWVGGSREAVGKALRMLRERGHVRTGPRTIIVLDLDGLRDVATGRRLLTEK